jgi:predicted outer membrane repeat protein
VRNAVAAGGGPYTFACDGLTTLTTEAEIVIAKDVILDGGSDIILDGGNSHRMFTVEQNVNAELHGFQLVRGNDAREQAGGILNRGTLTLTDCVLSMHAAGGLDNVGTATVANCVVSDNEGKGITNRFEARLTLTDSTVSDNVSNEFGRGGGIWSDGLLLSSGNTISGNDARESGGGIYNSGELTLINTTVSGNSAGSTGGGIHTDDSTVVVTLINSTVVDNSSPEGTALWNAGSRPVSLSGNVIEGTCAGPSAFASNGYNLESPGDTCGLAEATDQTAVSTAALNLGPLEDNGGRTQTHALGSGSVAIDVIPTAMCLDADDEPLTIDQRGELRPGGTMCDAGAPEVQQ